MKIYTQKVQYQKRAKKRKNLPEKNKLLKKRGRWYWLDLRGNVCRVEVNERTEIKEAHFYAGFQAFFFGTKRSEIVLKLEHKPYMKHDKFRKSLAFQRKQAWNAKAFLTMTTES